VPTPRRGRRSWRGRRGGSGRRIRRLAVSAGWLPFRPWRPGPAPMRRNGRESSGSWNGSRLTGRKACGRGRCRSGGRSPCLGKLIKSESGMVASRCGCGLTPRNDSGWCRDRTAKSWCGSPPTRLRPSGSAGCRSPNRMRRGSGGSARTCRRSPNPYFTPRDTCSRTPKGASRNPAGATDAVDPDLMHTQAAGCVAAGRVHDRQVQLRGDDLRLGDVQLEATRRL
jgi:hypothetical protein